tara:strand:- start:808 stop:1731 length:924 start_codon:yes stop_codon:yes gene_type:complete
MRFRAAGSASAANYINAGLVASRAGLSAIDSARAASPRYEDIANEAQKQDAKDYVQYAQSMSNMYETGASGARYVAQEELNQEINKANADAKKSQRMAGLLAAAGKGIGGFLQKSPERKMNEALYDSSIYTDHNAKLLDGINKIRGEEFTMTKPEGYTAQYIDMPEAPSKPAPTAKDGETPISSGQMLKGTGEYNMSKITDLAIKAGWSPDKAPTIAAIAMGESGGRAGIDTVQSGLDPNKSNEYSIGLSQINVQAHGDKLARRGWTEEDLRDPLKNLTIAKEVHDEVGGFSPWSVYQKGLHLPYLK